MKSIYYLAGAILALATFTPLAFGGESPKPGASDDAGPDAAKLWAQNCSRCHNLRPASTYSDAQWDTIVHHMRVRGYLTGAEARAIVEFLKEGN